MIVACCTSCVDTRQKYTYHNISQQLKGKRKMLEQKIEDLRRAIEALTEVISATPAAVPAVPDNAAPAATEQPQPTTEATPAPAAADEQSIKDLTLEMSRAGHRDAIRDKLSEFGVKKITDLKGDDAAAYYDWLLSLKGET
jgi:cell division septum initiation protein DivIVA